MTTEPAAAPDEDVDAEWVFEHLSLSASRMVRSSVALVLGSGGHMTVVAGGHSLSGEGTYEVLLDHDTARFWSKYSEDELGARYARVPAMLVRHHIISRGGITAMESQVDRHPAARVRPRGVWVPLTGLDDEAAEQVGILLENIGRKVRKMAKNATDVLE